MVGRRAREFGGTGVDGLERGQHPEGLAARAHDDLGRVRKVGDLDIGKAVTLRDAEGVGIHLVDTRTAQRFLHGDDIGHAVQEETVDARFLVDLGSCPSAAQGAADVDDAVAGRALEQCLVARLGLGSAHVAIDAQTGAPVLERAQRLSQSLLERAADSHDLADRLHACRERIVGILEFLERETGRLHHAIVDARLKACGRRARDVVHDFGERESHGQARGHLRDGEPRRLRCEG